MIFLFIAGTALAVGIWLLISVKLGEYIAEYYIGEECVNSIIIAIILFALIAQVLTYVCN